MLEVHPIKVCHLKILQVKGVVKFGGGPLHGTGCGWLDIFILLFHRKC
jgi:hypothetical protein